MHKLDSCGLDGITSRIVEENIEVFTVILTKLFRLSLSSGVFPDVLKTSIVVPLYKSGNTSDPTNYRPIALTSTISKIFEQCIKFKLVKHLESRRLLGSTQYGFRAAHSTDLAIFQQVTHISEALENGDKVAGVFLDLAKAFDTVNHHLLIRKLAQIKINGRLLQWFWSYRSNRNKL